MKNWILPLLVLLTVLPSCTSTKLPQPIPGDFAHIVLFWMEGQSEETKATFRAEMEGFIKSSAYAQSMHIGTPAGTNRSVVDNSYSFCLIVTFDSKKEHDLYQKEQVHLDFIEQTKGLWSKIQIYDSVR
ncbi:MAG: Dabb family protein [Phaeodactylibacter sp.]|nr:Dabb family protein [Phaeodactylibacter sp.]